MGRVFGQNWKSVGNKNIDAKVILAMTLNGRDVLKRRR